MANPIISAILSFIFPGVGQIINGRVIKGVILLILAIIMAGFAWIVFKHWIVKIIELAIMVYAAYDAYMLAQ